MCGMVPRTPFSTGLSQSAREIERRIRNIFSGPKKDPPLPVIVVTALAVLLCGSLVSFREQVRRPELVMTTQYYDTLGNYIEIPTLLPPGGGEPGPVLASINAALDGLREEYAGVMQPIPNTWEEHCLLYPTATDRYLNLLFYREQFATDLNSGHVYSLVYDMREDRQVTLEDALAAAGLTEEGLLTQVTEQAQAELDQNYTDFRLTLFHLTLEGFRMGGQGQPLFYLTAWTDDVDDLVQDNISGAEHLYIWEDGRVTTLDQYAGDEPPIVPVEETDKLELPLYCRWHYRGEEPEGGFVQIVNPYVGLYDPEVCLFQDGVENPIGPPLSLTGSFLEPLVQTREVLEGYGPIYREGDYWFQAEGEGFIARCYWSALEGRDTLYDLEVTRADLYTPRGIRVGSTREEVLAAYPDISTQPSYYGGYAQECFQYCSNAEGLGANLLFYFQDGRVLLIQLIDLFN